MKIKGFFLMFKGKKEQFLLIVIIIVIVSILSGISYAVNSFRNSMFNEIMSNYPVDCFGQSARDEDLNTQLNEFLASYDGWLEVEQKYEIHQVIIKNLEISLDYLNNSHHYEETWEFSDTWWDLYIIGIDSNLFTSIKNDEFDLITDIPYEFKNLNNSFLVAGLFQKYQSLLQQLNLNFSTDATSELEEDLPIFLNIGNYSQSKIFGNISNYSVKFLDTFTMFDEMKFRNMLDIRNDWELSPIFLTTLQTVDELFKNISVVLTQINFYEKIGLKFNKDWISQKTPTEFESEFRRFRSFSEFPFEFFISQGLWQGELSNLNINNIRFQSTAILYFLPLFLISYKLLKLIFRYIVNTHQQEYSLYLVNGMSRKYLKRNIGFQAILFGFLGGILGTFTGLMLFQTIEKNLFNIEATSFLFYLGNYSNQIWLDLAINGLISAILCWISVRSTLKNFFKLDLNEMLSSSPLNSQILPTKKKLERVIFFILLIVFVIGLIYDHYYGIPNYNELVDEDPLIFWSLSLLGPLMALFPFVFPLISLSLLTEKLEPFSRWIHSKWIQRSRFRLNNHSLMQKINRFFDFQLVTWSFQKNTQKNKNLLELLTLSLVFIFLMTILNISYQYSLGIHASLHNGNGDILNIDINDIENLSDIQAFNLKFDQNRSNLDLRNINAICHSKLNSEHYTSGKYAIKILYNGSSLWYYRFSCMNYTNLLQNSVLIDEWFIGGSYREIMEKMNQPDAVLIPNYMLSANFSIGDYIYFQYLAKSGELIQKRGHIIGAYSHFPVSYLERNYAENLDYELYMNPNLINETLISQVEYILYTDTSLTLTDKHEIIEFVKNTFSGDINVQFSDLSRYYDLFDQKSMELVQIEGRIIIIYALFGFFAFSILGSNQSKLDIGILHAKGISEKDLRKNSFIESSLLFCIGGALSIISIFGIKGLMVYLNLQRDNGGKAIFPIYYTLNIWYILGILFCGGLIFVLINHYLNVHQIMQTRTNQKLELYLRRSI